MTGADLAGNTTTMTCVFKVEYDFDGFLAPVKNPPQVNFGVVGRTFTLKWQLRDAAGSYVSHLGVVVRQLAKPSSCSAFSTDPTGAVTAASPRSLRYDPATNAYNFAWATSGLAASCYTLMLELDSGQFLFAYFRLR